MRVKIASIFIICMFISLSLCLFNLEVGQGEKNRDLSKKNCIRLLSQAGARGKILDRDGNVIVGNKLSYNVMILPQKLTELDNMKSIVSRVTGIGTND